MLSMWASSTSSAVGFDRSNKRFRRWDAGGDHAMTSNSTTPCLPQSETETAVHLFDSWFDPIEAGLRDRVRDFLHAMFEGELDVLLSRPRYGRRGLNGSNGSGES